MKPNGLGEGARTGNVAGNILRHIASGARADIEDATAAYGMLAHGDIDGAMKKLETIINRNTGDFTIIVYTEAGYYARADEFIMTREAAQRKNAETG